MECLRAEVRELGSFVIRKRGEGKCLRDSFRIRANEPADILPYFNRWQLKGVRHDGGTVIGSAAAERRRLAFSGEAEESRDHAHTARLGLAPEERRKTNARLVEQCRGVPVGVVRDETDSVCLVRRGVNSRQTQIRRDDLRGQPLPEREDKVPRARRDLLRVRDPVKKALQLRHEGVDRRTALSRALTGLRQEAEMVATKLRDVQVDLLLLARLRQDCDEGVRYA